MPFDLDALKNFTVIGFDRKTRLADHMGGLGDYLTCTEAEQNGWIVDVSPLSCLLFVFVSCSVCLISVFVSVSSGQCHLC